MLGGTCVYNTKGFRLVLEKVHIVRADTLLGRICLALARLRLVSKEELA